MILEKVLIQLFEELSFCLKEHQREILKNVLMGVCSEGKRRKDFLEKCRSKINSLQLGFEFGGIRLLLYVKNRVFGAFQTSLDVPKGLRLSPHQRMMFWAPKTKVLEPIKMTCVHMHVHERKHRILELLNFSFQGPKPPSLMGPSHDT